MELKGTVLNVVDFGAFVDIGLKDSGLVHISQLANRYIKSPHDVVSVGDVVTAWVMGVDQERKRVSLTMVKPGTERHPQWAVEPQGGPRGGEPRDREQENRGAGQGQGRRGGLSAADSRSRPPGSGALTSPPVGAPLGRRPARAAKPGGPPPRSGSRPRPRSGPRSQRPGRPPLRRGPGWGSARRDDTDRRPRTGRVSVRPAAVRIAGPAATDHLVSIAIVARPRARPGRHGARVLRLPRSPRTPWPAMSRSGRSASSSSSGKPGSRARNPMNRAPPGAPQQPADHAQPSTGPQEPAMYAPERAESPTPPETFRRSRETPAAIGVNLVAQEALRLRERRSPTCRCRWPWHRRVG